MKIFLAINNGCEGWSLEEFDCVQDVLDAIKNGGTFGSPFKIMREIELKTEESVCSWEKYPYGPADITFYDEDGSPFNGTADELNKLIKIGESFPIRNKLTGEVLIINSRGKVLGVGHANL